MLFDENWIDETSAICLRFSRVYNSTGAVRFGSGSNLFWLTIDQVIQLTIVWKIVEVPAAEWSANKNSNMCASTSVF